MREIRTSGATRGGGVTLVTSPLLYWPTCWRSTEGSLSLEADGDGSHGALDLALRSGAPQ